MNESAVDGTNHRINAPNRFTSDDAKGRAQSRRFSLKSDHQTALMGLLLDRP